MAHLERESESERIVNAYFYKIGISNKSNVRRCMVVHHLKRCKKRYMYDNNGMWNAYMILSYKDSYV